MMHGDAERSPEWTMPSWRRGRDSNPYSLERKVLFIYENGRLESAESGELGHGLGHNLLGLREYLGNVAVQPTAI
jgi:hypothetical protein